MQISSINMVLPRTSYSFKGNTEGTQRRRRSERDFVERKKEVSTPQVDRYHSSKKNKHTGRNALLLAMAAATAGTIAGNVATQNTLKNRAAQNPIPIISEYSGAPIDLIYEWQINGMTVYPEKMKQPVVAYNGDFSAEQRQNIKNAQDSLADVYYNANNGQCYLVLKRDSDIRNIKATFGLSQNLDSSVERLNNLYNKPTIGADLNSAKIKKGEIVKFDMADAGVKENFYGSLLIETQKTAK